MTDTLAAREILDRHEAQLLKVEGVEGIGIGEDPEGRMYIKVLVGTPAEDIKKLLPQELEGIPVRVTEAQPDTPVDTRLND